MCRSRSDISSLQSRYDYEYLLGDHLWQLVYSFSLENESDCSLENLGGKLIGHHTRLKIK